MNRHWSAAVHMLESRTMNTAARGCWIYLSARWLRFPHVYPNQTASSWILMLWISATHSKPSVWKTREPTTNTKTRRLESHNFWTLFMSRSQLKQGARLILQSFFSFMHSCSVSKTSFITLCHINVSHSNLILLSTGIKLVIGFIVLLLVKW